MAPPKHEESRSKGKNVVEETGSQVPERYKNIHYFANTGLWGTYMREPWTGGKRLYFGLHLTQNLALRCQDRALLKYEAEALKPLALNFPHSDYDDDKELRDKLTHEEWRELLRAESHDSYNKVEPTSCLKRFWDEEVRVGNISESKKDAKMKKGVADVMPMSEYLDVVMKHRVEKMLQSVDPRDPPPTVKENESRGKKVVPSVKKMTVDQAGAGHLSAKRTRPPSDRQKSSLVGNTRSAIPQEGGTVAALSVQTLRDALLFKENYNFKKQLILKFSREVSALENQNYKKRLTEKFASEWGAHGEPTDRSQSVQS